MTGKPSLPVPTIALSWGSYGASRGIERLLRVLDRAKRSASVMVSGIFGERTPATVPSPSLDRIYQLGLWSAIFFAIFLRLSPNEFLRFRRTFSPVSIRLALLFLLIYVSSDERTGTAARATAAA